jgi:hypothetical protein
MQEREKQLDHYDALDTKAGVLLAFAGVLIVVARGIRFAYLLPGTVFARQLASPHCCSLRPATDQVGRLRIHFDLGQRSSLQLDFDCSENA